MEPRSVPQFGPRDDQRELGGRSKKFQLRYGGPLPRLLLPFRLWGSAFTIVDADSFIRLRVEALAFKGLEVLHFKASTRAEMTWDRDKPSEANRAFLGMITTGEAEITLPDGRVYRRKAGEGGIIFPGPGTVTMSCPGEIQGVILGLEMRYLGVSPASDEGVALFAEVDNPVWQPVYGLIRSITEGTTIESPVVAQSLQSVVLAGARALVTNARYAASHPTVYERGVDAIEVSHTNPAANVLTVAKKLNISRRTLERSFAARGERVADVLRARRLRHAGQLLEQETPMTLPEIAAASGFANAAALRRAQQSRPK